MLIVCPSCATSYDVRPESLQPMGRQVRCVRCHTVWRAQATRAEQLVAAADAIGVEAAAAAEAGAADPHGSVATERAGPIQRAEGLYEPREERAADEHAPAGGGAGAASAVGAGDEAYAAEPGGPSETVDVEAPPIVPVDLDENKPPLDIAGDEAEAQSATPAEDIESYAARHYKPPRRHLSLRWPLSALQNVILLFVIIDAVLIGWRSEVVRLLPQTASLYSLIGLPVNVRGIALEGITTSTEQHDGVPILVVEGNIVNETHRVVDVPRLKFALRNAAREEIYSWTAVPPRTTLPPGETASFRSRLASPPPDGRDILVRFVTRRDIVAGAH